MKLLRCTDRVSISKWILTKDIVTEEFMSEVRWQAAFLWIDSEQAANSSQDQRVKKLIIHEINPFPAN